MGELKKGEGCASLWVCRGGGEYTTSQELLDMISMVRGKVTTTEPKVDDVYSVGVDHGEWTSASLWTCACFPKWVTELYSLSGVSQVALSEKGTSPLL